MEGRTTRSGYLSSTIEGSHLSQGGPGQWAGKTHLNSDAKIADEGRPQGGEGTHKGCPYLLFSAKKPAFSRQRRMEFAIAHYDLHSSRRYALRRAPTRGGGHPQGVPLPSFFGQETGLQSPKTYGICDSALRSAQFQALCPEKGAHKGGRAPTRGAPTFFFRPRNRPPVAKDVWNLR